MKKTKNPKIEDEWTDEVGIIGTGEPKKMTDEEYEMLKAAMDKVYNSYSPEYKREIKFRHLKYDMKNYLQEKRPKFQSVGYFLKQHISILEITNKAFAKYLKIEASNLSAILDGKRKMSLDLAAKLGRLFEADAALWLSVQNKNELMTLEKKYKEKYKKISIEDLLKKAS
ncbi:MAG: HigA family addiction module antitoxin [Bacteroidota bacterium]